MSLLFFFSSRRRHTRCSRDWSSDVCSSDLMGDARIAEYDPFMGTCDRYLDVVTPTVKPIVDAQFPTLPDRRHTGIAGSSMGGLVSLYAFFRYSESFGFAAALRPSLSFADGALLDLVARAARVSG